ncbi:MAG: TonB-dependent receptor [Betaproteobacteria bacterium]|nr:TonB-dependent receptor [Betaproteobacteria bacterium]
MYRNAAQVLAAQRSKQWEASLRKAWGAQAGMEGQLALTVFRIERPSAADVEITALPGEPMLERLPAALLARHQGLEFQASLDAAEFGQFQLAAQRTQAKTVESLLANREGAPVLNVAPWSLHLLHRWPIADSRWQWQNRLYAVGRKPVLLANARPGDVDLALAARWQWDSALHWQQKLPQLRLRWTLAATNLFDRADWREAPTQSWGGTYLFPVQARSLRMALQAHW